MRGGLRSAEGPRHDRWFADPGGRLAATVRDAVFLAAGSHAPRAVAFGEVAPIRSQ